ncbi:MAG: hypothetical protein PHE59_03990 [Patescibacteria group bacterium]|nr:hypothetical protein [Patescibacteria group bacterium]MDD5164503.1 hypothetical protein [Patescibacteria group bacterium]MDD5534153.1 hypothetical protein [Patescibacteria group bacterium]
MFKLKFEINKIYLYLQLIKQAEFLDKNKKLLGSSLWKKSESTYYILSGIYYNWFISSLSLENREIKTFIQALSKKIKIAEKILKKEFQSREFKKIYQETKNYKKEIENQWSKNKEEALKHLKNITGITLPDATLTVYLVHPALHNGRYWGKKLNIITYGHSEDWQNYTTVYLCHEIMHFLTKNYSGDKTNLHALIELICDNELRIRLNKNGKYFQERKFKIGHKSLRKLEKQILPQWHKYLRENKNGKNSFFTFSKNIDKKIGSTVL